MSENPSIKAGHGGHPSRSRDEAQVPDSTLFYAEDALPGGLKFV